ncbi:MAG: hypothetical protein RQM92_09920 [Candidatus Syntrophopropionicum ammoniitolerans]
MARTPVQEDLLNYLNEQTPRLAAMENEVVEELDSVIGKNYSNDIETYQVIVDKVIPGYRDFMEALEAVKPATPEVVGLHEIYIDAVNKQFNAIVQISAAIENQDTNLISHANEKLSEGRKGIRTYENELQALAQKHNVVLQEGS